MPQPLQSSFPEIELEPGMQIVFEAIDPATGVAVPGVEISAVAIYSGGPGASKGEFQAGPLMFVPGLNT